MKKQLLLLFALLASYAGLAQTAASYPFSTSTATYTSIAATGTTLAINGDDITSTAIPLGFTFNFCGTNYTTAKANSNGFLSFLSTTFSSMLYPSATAIPSASPMIAPYWADLIGTTGAAYYSTTGTAPNRVFTVEFSSWQYYASIGSLNFQIKLYESTNTIDFCYGPTSGSSSLSSAIGIAASGTDYQMLTTSYTTTTTFPGGTITMPASGTVFTWNGSSCSGTPTAGTATATLYHSCSAATVALALSGASAGTGISYQWQSSTDGITWTNITGATATAATVPFTATTTTYYRCNTTCSGSSTSAATPAVSVTPNIIRGDITFTPASSDTSVKVWLVYYNPADSSITAVDSTIACMNAGTLQYEFVNEAAGTYRVKAKDLASVPGTSGYLPTYSLSSSYWGTAATAAHTTGWDVLNINMTYGTVPSGPGFIGGFVYSGAGRNTTSEAPAPDMLVYLRDASGNILTYTYTDATGAYSFSGIAYGTYTIYPEDMGYATIPSATLTLDASNDTLTAVNFRQYTDSRIIKPYSSTTAINDPATLSFTIAPNPATASVAIYNTGGTSATITIKNMVGQVVLNTATAGSATRVDVSALPEGMFFVTMSQNGISQTQKLMIRK